MKGLYAIPLGIPFLPALVKGLIEETALNPLALASYCIIMPTGRGCRGLHEAFQAATPAGGRILPRIIDLADTENGAELPGFNPPTLLPRGISHLKCLGILAQLIHADKKKQGAGISSPVSTLQLAQELIRLIEEVEISGLKLANLKNLVGMDFASHWQRTLDFLNILIDYWPGILANENAIEPIVHQRLTLQQIVDYWRPQFPVILAGATGSRPATSALMQAILKMNKGRVVLPGVDPCFFEENSSTSLGTELDFPPSHPQHTLSRFIYMTGRPSLWPSVKYESLLDPKMVFLAKAMACLPDKNWRLTLDDKQNVIKNIKIIEADTALQEAQQIALIMRYELETPHQTIALVTPDANLTLRVQATLRRWNIHANVAKGKRLSQTLAGRFLLASANLATSMNATDLLALLNHPFYAKGKDRLDHLNRTRSFEMNVLRSADKLNNNQEIQKLLFPDHELCTPLFDFNDSLSYPLADFLTVHKSVAEALTGDRDILWGQEDGHAAFALWQDLQRQAKDFPSLSAQDYPAFLRIIMDKEIVRDGQGTDSRILIVGTREARFLTSEVVIMGSLNEGTWPGHPQQDPWLSRAMRESFGLPPLEQKTGLSAHDFCMAFSAPKVYMTRSLKQDGAATLPSRWWQRFKALLETGDAKFPLDREWGELAKQMDQPLQRTNFLPPAPCPPVAMRPRQISVTAVEILLRDPYSIYAKTILNLRPLNLLDTEISMADRGQLIHYILEYFVKSGIDADSYEAIIKFEALGKNAFRKLGTDPRVTAFWQPRLLRLGQWFIDQIKADKKLVEQIFPEQNGFLEIMTSGGPVRLTAKADRIDKMISGGVRIIDYKTGTVPAVKSVQAGYAPQLPLEGIILKAGGFHGVTSTKVDQLSYWKVTGGAPPGEIHILKKVEDLMTMAEQGVQGLLEAFLAKETPFFACPDSQNVPSYNDYAHLERLKEWA